MHKYFCCLVYYKTEKGLLEIKLLHLWILWCLHLQEGSAYRHFGLYPSISIDLGVIIEGEKKQLELAKHIVADVFRSLMSPTEGISAATVSTILCVV